jgi:hypothetical protein
MPMSGASTPIVLDEQLAGLLAYHLVSLARDTGTFGLSAREGIHADVVITPSSMSETDGSVWDSVTINGHSCGNRCGGARAYALMVAGVTDWWKP